MKPIGSKPIRTQRLLLRAPEHEDAAALVQIRSLTMTLPEAEKAVANMVAECKMPFCYHWVITLDGAIIGRIKAWDVAPYNGYLQLGYDIGADYRNQGYMTEAVRAVVRYMMTEADANRVYCSVRSGNTASRRVCEKAGMTHEGTLRQHYARQDGGYDDVCIYGVIRQDIGKGSDHGTEF